MKKEGTGNPYPLLLVERQQNIHNNQKIFIILISPTAIPFCAMDLLV